MPATLQVSPAEMQRLEGVVDQKVAELQSIVNNVRATAEALLGSWTGQASQVYQQTVQEWIQGAGVINNLLMELKNGLQAARNQLVTNEENTAAAVAQGTG
jgi:WXG100 family type VII secretion target